MLTVLYAMFLYMISKFQTDDYLLAACDTNLYSKTLYLKKCYLSDLKCYVILIVNYITSEITVGVVSAICQVVFYGVM